MICNVNHIVQRVRTEIGLSEGIEQLFAGHDPDIITINDIIRHHIVGAVTKVHSEAPAWMLSDIKRDLAECGVYWGKNISNYYEGHVLLPDNFMRLLYFKMTDWQIPVQQLTECDQLNYRLSFSRQPALRGTPQRPRCFITQMPEGRVLEFRSCRSHKARIEHGFYVVYPKIEALNTIEVAHRCMDMIIKECALRVRNTTN